MCPILHLKSFYYFCTIIWVWVGGSFFFLKHKILYCLCPVHLTTRNFFLGIGSVYIRVLYIETRSKLLSREEQYNPTDIFSNFRLLRLQCCCFDGRAARYLSGWFWWSTDWYARPGAFFNCLQFRSSATDVQTDRQISWAELSWLKFRLRNEASSYLYQAHRSDSQTRS